jgi:hypothetical protein
MKLWSRSHSLQRKIITAIVMVGLLPLGLLLLITYLEEHRALRETTGANFKEVAVEVSRRIEMHVTRGINEAQQLATAPFLRTAVTEANRTYEGKDPQSIQEMIKDWQQRWRQRDKRSEFPLFINRIVTNYLIRWHDIRKSDYVGILVTDNQGALVVSSIPQVDYFYGKTAWWRAVAKAKQPQAYVGEIAFDPAFGTHVLVVAAPILDDAQGTAIGTVTILLRRDTLFRSISDALQQRRSLADLPDPGAGRTCRQAGFHQYDYAGESGLGDRDRRFARQPQRVNRICAGSFHRTIGTRQHGRKTMGHGGASGPR